MLFLLETGDLTFLLSYPFVSDSSLFTHLPSRSLNRRLQNNLRDTLWIMFIHFQSSASFISLLFPSNSVPNQVLSHFPYPPSIFSFCFSLNAVSKSRVFLETWLRENRNSSADGAEKAGNQFRVLAKDHFWLVYCQFWAIFSDLWGPDFYIPGFSWSPCLKRIYQRTFQPLFYVYRPRLTRLARVLLN